MTPHDFFKNIKCRCNYCFDVISPKNDNDWISCSCGQTSIKGKNFISIRGNNYTDLSQFNYDSLPEYGK